MNEEMLENMLSGAMKSRAVHVPFGDLAQRAIRTARTRQLVKLRRMSQVFSAIAMVMIVGIVAIGYQRYSILATSWASTDAASTISGSMTSTTWISYQSPVMVVAMLVGGVVVALAILWQFVGDDPRNSGGPILG